MRKALILLKFLVFLSLSQAFYANALNLNINGQLVNTQSESIVDGRILGAKLAETTTLQLGQNQIKDIPAGSIVSFQENSGVTDELLVAGLIINAKIENQTWTQSTGEKLQLNCGKYKSSAAFIHFSKNFELLAGCTSTIEQTLKTSSEDQVIALEGSKLEFFTNGNLKASSKTTGRIRLPGLDKVSLASGSSLHYHDNEGLYFFYPAPKARFTAYTEMGGGTTFTQPEGVDIFPVIFHDNGQISTGFLNNYFPYNIKFSAYGTEVRLSIKTGPIGFDENGKINRLLATQAFSLSVEEETFVRSTEVNTQIVSYGHFVPGDTINFQPQTQLFLEVEGTDKVLRGYPEQGNHGLVYFNELSTEPFNRNLTIKNN